MSSSSSSQIKGFAKSLPKTIEGGKIVSEAGWREVRAYKFKRVN